MDEVQKAITIIKKGGVVIFPTDTAFGIGCRVDDEAAVKRFFALRRRPADKATPVLISDLQMAQKYLQPVDSDVKERLMDRFWPGGLTIVLKCHVEAVPELVRREDTLGVRIPNHPTTLAIIKGVGVPIIGSSANFPGEQTPYAFEDLNPELVKIVDYVVPGETFAKVASTVIDVTQHPWKILRQGAVEVPIDEK